MKSLTVTVLLALFSTVVVAQEATPKSEQVSVRPNAGSGPDEITVFLGLLDIVNVDDREKLFTIDMFLDVRWQDPRLALEDEDEDSVRRFELGDIWTPRLTIVNDRGLDSRLPETAIVDRAGNVSARVRLEGPLAVDLQLRDFPFDTQLLSIEFVSYEYTPSEITFSEDSALIARLDEMSGDGWEYSALAPESFAFKLRDEGTGAAGLRFAVSAERDSTYYLFTLALPMTLILFLAWMAHWIPVNIVPPRMATASATVFSVVALGVSFRLTLPKITFLTIADRYGLYSTLLVLISLAATVASIRWASTDRKDAAERLSRYARIAFPFLYALVIFLTFAS